MEFVISNIATLERLKSDKSIKNSVRRIRLIVNGFDTKEYEYLINKNYFACGCKQGTVAVYISALSLLVIWLIERNIALFQWKWILAILFSSAVIGKVIGLVYSYYQFNKLYNDIYLKIAEQCTPENAA